VGKIIRIQNQRISQANHQPTRYRVVVLTSSKPDHDFKRLMIFVRTSSRK
jgi:hypothetical protein